MFSNFEIPSEESVEEKEEQVKNDSNKFSRLEFNKLNDKEKDTPKEDQKEKETKIDTHRHDLFDDVVIKKKMIEKKKALKKMIINLEIKLKIMIYMNIEILEMKEMKNIIDMKKNIIDMKKKKESDTIFDPLDPQYKNSKSISNTLVFGSDDDDEEQFDESRLIHTNVSSVSSNYYFGIPKETKSLSGIEFSQRLKDTMVDDISKLKDGIKEGGQKLVDLYHNFFNT